MNKKMKRLIILGCVLAVVSVAAVGVLHYEAEVERIRTSDEIILQIPSDTVTALSWDNETESLSFRKDDTWHKEGDPAFPVNEKKMSSLLEPFREFGVTFVIEDVEDFAQYGLDEPVCTIRITTSTALPGVSTVEEDDPEEAEETENPESHTYEIRLGAFSTMDSQRYLSIGDGNVYLVSEDPLDLYSAGVRDMIRNDDDLSYNKVYELKIEGAEPLTVQYAEDSPDALSSEDVYFTLRDGKNVPLDTSRVGSYLEHLVTLNPTDYVTYQANESSLSEYGLDNPELTVTVDYDHTGDPEETLVRDTFTVHVGRNAEEVRKAEEAAAEAAENGDDDFEPETVPAYIRIGDSQIIYRITDDQYDSLMTGTFNDLRHHEVFASDFENVTELDISLEGSHYVITKTVPEDDKEEASWHYGDTEIDITKIESALTSLTAAEFTDEPASGKEEISLTVRLDDENHPEIKISLYRYDGDRCLSCVDGRTFALTERSLVVNLVEAVNTIVLQRS